MPFLVCCYLSSCFPTTCCHMCIMDVQSNRHIYLCSHLNVAARHELLKERKIIKKKKGGRSHCLLRKSGVCFVQNISFFSTLSSQRALSVVPFDRNRWGIKTLRKEELKFEIDRKFVTFETKLLRSLPNHFWNVIPSPNDTKSSILTCLCHDAEYRGNFYSPFQKWLTQMWKVLLEGLHPFSEILHMHTDTEQSPAVTYRAVTCSDFYDQSKLASEKAIYWSVQDWGCTSKHLCRVELIPPSTHRRCQLCMSMSPLYFFVCIKQLPHGQ